MTDDDLYDCMKCAPFDQEALHRWFFEEISRRGFNHYILVRVSGPGSDDGMAVGNYPSEYMKIWDQERYVDVDPVRRAATSAEQPFLWSDLPDWAPTSPRRQQFLDLVNRFGLLDGLTVPFNRLVGGRARVNMCGFKGEHEKLQDMLRSDGAFFHTVGPVLDLVTTSLPATWPTTYTLTPTLTTRQVECLTWLREGKTAHEMAIILGITVATVRFHIDRAKRILGTTTIAHTVDRATRAGLLPKTQSHGALPATTEEAFRC